VYKLDCNKVETVSKYLFDNLKMKFERIFDKNGLGCSFLFSSSLRLYFTRTMTEILRGLPKGYTGTEEGTIAQGYEEGTGGREGLSHARPFARASCAYHVSTVLPHF